MDRSKESHERNSSGSHWPSDATFNPYAPPPQQQQQYLSTDTVASPTSRRPPHPESQQPRSRQKQATSPYGEGSDHDDYFGGKRAAPSSARVQRKPSFNYLPFHSKSRVLSSSSTSVASKLGRIPRGLRRRILIGAAVVLVTALLALWHCARTYEVQVEFSVFNHKWVRNEIDEVKPLKGCFSSPYLTPEYNMTAHLAPRHHMLSPGLALRRGMSCYDYASTIQPVPNTPLDDLLYHTYWRSDLSPFGDRQADTLVAFLATQPLQHSKLVIWSNGAETLRANVHLSQFLSDWPRNIEVRQADLVPLSRGTELEHVFHSPQAAALNDERAWVDGDAIRLLALWHHGGIWMDMDQVLTRDLHTLAETEWVTQWDCYDKPYFQMNGAMMHFRKHSPYLCEAFHIMATSPLPEPNSFTWGSNLYGKLHRRLIAGHVAPFAVLPWCFTDPRNCRSDIRFPDPFSKDPGLWAGLPWAARAKKGADASAVVPASGRDALESKMGYLFSVHLHNQWTKAFPEGGYMDRLMGRYHAKVDRMRRE